MQNQTPVTLGLDLGTSGVRALAVSATGSILASASCALPRTQPGPPGHHEQDPADWWRATLDTLAQLVAALPSEAELVALSVDGTSGTVLGVDADGVPSTPALMYDDGRAVREAEELTALCPTDRRVNATSGLAKMRWLQGRAPIEFAATETFLHQADYIAARLTGDFGVTDASNALKSGYDLSAEAWSEWTTGLPEIRQRLPRVVQPGEVIGEVSEVAAKETGLPRGVRVVAGVSDGTAGFLASGASRPGEDNTTLGTTLVFKRVATREVRDAGGLLYCHRLPGGVWLPGAASNVGGGWIQSEFADRDLRELDRAAEPRLPCVELAYPLLGQGERFPFRSADARGFCEPALADPTQLYAAKLQGTAFVERLAYELLDEAGGGSSRSEPVFATGGGARSDVWMQLRADVCGRVLHRPACFESAFGTAVLAASASLFDDLWTASRHMVRVEASFHPDPKRGVTLDEYYARFRASLERHGYLSASS